MRTVELKLYSFDELNDNAKETAREWFRSGNLDYEWWDCVYEDAETIAEILGIDIDNISFTGFWSQGDGANFTGTYAYRKGWKEALAAYVGGDDLKSLMKIGATLQAAQQAHFYRLEATVTHTGRYCHERSNTINVENRNSLDCYGYPDAAPQDAHEQVEEALRSFMVWIYRKLEVEYEFLQSDEVIDEAICSNEYEFTASGKAA